MFASLVVVKVAAANEPTGEDLGFCLEEDDGIGHTNVSHKLASLLHVSRVPIDQEALPETDSELEVEWRINGQLAILVHSHSSCTTLITVQCIKIWQMVWQHGHEFLLCMKVYYLWCFGGGNHGLSNEVIYDVIGDRNALEHELAEEIVAEEVARDVFVAAPQVNPITLCTTPTSRPTWRMQVKNSDLNIHPSFQLFLYDRLIHYRI